MLPIIISLIVLIIFAVLFYFADTLTKDKKAESPKASKNAVKTDSGSAASATSGGAASASGGATIASAQSSSAVEPRTIPNASRNLADDMQTLLEVSKEKTVDPRWVRRGKRSHLANKSRMKDYFEFKHRQNRALGNDEIYDDNSRGHANEVLQPSSGIQLTADDIKRLKMMQEVLERKGLWPDDSVDG